MRECGMHLQDCWSRPHVMLCTRSLTRNSQSDLFTTCQPPCITTAILHMPLVSGLILCSQYYCSTVMIQKVPVCSRWQCGLCGSSSFLKTSPPTLTLAKCCTLRSWCSLPGPDWKIVRLETHFHTFSAHLTLAASHLQQKYPRVIPGSKILVIQMG